MQTPGRKGHALDGGPAPGPCSGRAVAHRRCHVLLWTTVGLGLAVDLVSKRLAWHFLGPPPAHGGSGAAYDLAPGWLQLVTSENPGIVFGLNLAHGLGAVWGRVATVGLTAVTCVLMFYLFAVSGPRQRWLHLCAGLVLAGGLGNLYDRLLFGAVRDFLQITGHVTVFGRTLAWPYVFNVADVWLVVGVAGVAVAGLFGSPPRAETPRDQTRP